MSKPLNVVINKEDENTELPPLKMNDVFLPQLFKTLEAASRKLVIHFQRRQFRIFIFLVDDDIQWLTYGLLDGLDQLCGRAAGKIYAELGLTLGCFIGVKCPKAIVRWNRINGFETIVAD